MKIYTKSGDDGTTSLYGGDRVSKDEQRIEAYGTVDELNSALGVSRAFNPASEIGSLLETIQSDLFIVGAELAASEERQRSLRTRVHRSMSERLERAIDEYETRLPPLSTFILPGGAPFGASLHAARAVCRRAEREVVRLMKRDSISPEPIVYLNRLSDLLFVLARAANREAGMTEIPWTSGGEA